MTAVSRSRPILAALLLLIGAAGVGHWLYWLFQPATGWDVTDSLAGAQVFVFAPTALAGAVLVVGGGLMLRGATPGRIVATVGLALAVLFALYWGIAVGASLNTCSALALGCALEGSHLAAAGIALAVAVSLIVAVWRSGRPARP